MVRGLLLQDHPPQHMRILPPGQNQQLLLHNASLPAHRCLRGRWLWQGHGWFEDGGWVPVRVQVVQDQQPWAWWDAGFAQSTAQQ